MRRIINLMLIVWGILSVIGAQRLAEAAPDTSRGKLLFHCLLDKSNTLNVYRDSKDAVDAIIFEIENFLGSREDVVVLHRPVVVEYGNVFIALKDEGRSGYFLLRFEKGKKPEAGDIGDSVVSIDNNLFQLRESRLFTGGALTGIRDCVSAVGGH